MREILKGRKGRQTLSDRYSVVAFSWRSDLCMCQWYISTAFVLRLVVLRLCRDDGNKQLLGQVNVWQGAKKTTPRIFCGIFTHQANHATKMKASQYRLQEKFKGNGLSLHSCVDDFDFVVNYFCCVGASYETLVSTRCAQQSKLGIACCQPLCQCHLLVAHGKDRNDHHTSANRQNT